MIMIRKRSIPWKKFKSIICMLSFVLLLSACVSKADSDPEYIIDCAYSSSNWILGPDYEYYTLKKGKLKEINKRTFYNYCSRETNAYSKYADTDSYKKIIIKCSNNSPESWKIIETEEYIPATETKSVAQDDILKKYIKYLKEFVPEKDAEICVAVSSSGDYRLLTIFVMDQKLRLFFSSEIMFLFKGDLLVSREVSEELKPVIFNDPDSHDNTIDFYDYESRAIKADKFRYIYAKIAGEEPENWIVTSVENIKSVSDGRTIVDDKMFNQYTNYFQSLNPEKNTKTKIQISDFDNYRLISVYFPANEKYDTYNRVRSYLFFKNKLVTDHFPTGEVHIYEK